MNDLVKKQLNRQRRIHRIRSTVIGTIERPRLSVHISNMHVTAQVVDDSRSATLAYSTTHGRKEAGTMSEKAAWVGSDIAQKAKKAKVKAVVFDRGGKRYHGRIKLLADAARKEGLEF